MFSFPATSRDATADNDHSSRTSRVRRRSQSIMRDALLSLSGRKRSSNTVQDIEPETASQPYSSVDSDVAEDRQYLLDWFNYCCTMQATYIRGAERLAPLEKLRTILIIDTAEPHSRLNGYQKEQLVRKIHTLTIPRISTPSDGTKEMKEVAGFLWNELKETNKLIRSARLPDSVSQAFKSATIEINQSIFLQYLHSRGPFPIKKSETISAEAMMIHWMISTSPDWVAGLVSYLESIHGEEDGDVIAEQLRSLFKAKDFDEMREEVSKGLNLVALVRRKLTISINDEYRKRIEEANARSREACYASWG